MLLTSGHDALMLVRRFSMVLATNTPAHEATIDDAAMLPATMSLLEFLHLTGTPKGRGYELAAKDQLPVPVHRIGTRYVLSRSLVERWLAGEYTRTMAK